MKALTQILSRAMALVGTISLLSAAPEPTPLVTRTADQLVATLKSDASLKDKADACRELSVIGGKNAVPALAALLADERLGHMARYALEAIPDPAATDAIRAGLQTVSGPCLVGLIGSAGVRRDALAVPELASLMSNPNRDVAQAAARALGTIGTPAAVAALRPALGDGTGPNAAAVAEGLLRAAEQLSGAGARQEALQIFTQLRALQGPQQVRAAAVCGLIRASGKDAAAAFRDALRAEDYVVFAAAVRTYYELSEPRFGKILAEELPRIAQEDRQILLIQALGRQSESVALTALAAAARTGEKRVRLTAIRSLAETGKPRAASVLGDLILSPDLELARAALDALAGVGGKEADSTVTSLLKSKQAAARLAGIELVGRRRMFSALPKLLKMAREDAPEVRPAALGKIGELGGPNEAKAVVSALDKWTGSADLDAAEQALTLLCVAGGRSEEMVALLNARFAEVAAQQKAVLLHVLSTIGGAAALGTVRESIRTSDPAVHAAAVRALSAWKTSDAAPDLLALARSGGDGKDRTLALRGYLGLAASSDLPSTERLVMCREAAKLVRSDEERSLLLGALGSLDSVEAVSLIDPYFDQPATRDEASAAVVALSERLLKIESADAGARLTAPLQRAAESGNPEVAKRAKALLEKARQQSSNRRS